MGLFRSHPPVTEPELSPELVRRLDQLAAANERQERIIKDIRLEWDEMYDKFRLLLARNAKRIKDAAAAEAAANGEKPAEDTPSRPTPYLGPSARRNY